MKHPLLACVLLCASSPAQLWNQRSPATSPPAASSRMVYDSTRGVCMMFGGALGGSQYSNSTWEWDGLNWLLANPPTKPSPRSQHGMAFDPVRGVTVLFGGYLNGSTATNETWEYSGSDWTQITTNGAPSARSPGGMVYDMRTLKIVLQGGSGIRDTWEYDGITKTWTQINVPTPPDQALQFAMVYDLLRGKTIVFGGVTTAFALLNSLWEYDGTAKTWTQVPPVGTVPRTRRLLQGVFDPRGVMMVHGGDKLPGELSDTWEYNPFTQTWTDKTVTPGPVLNREYSMAWDGRRSTAVLFGGLTNNAYTNWTWEHGTRGRVVAFGSGCPGSASIGTPSLAALGAGPILGQTLTTRISPAPNGAVVILAATRLAAPIDLGFVGAPGCSLLVGTDLFLPLGATSGVVDFMLPIPPVLGYSGAQFFEQALVVDPAANALKHVMTNAVEATIL